jgi:hypothetical protein
MVTGSSGPQGLERRLLEGKDMPPVRRPGDRNQIAPQEERRKTPRTGPPSVGSRRHLHVAKHAVPVLFCVAIAAGLLLRGDGGPDGVPYVAPPPAIDAPDAPTWRAAARKVEEPRGEPMGRAASVRIPAELRHYSDTRRFLAVQVAGWREQGYPLPHDDAELAEMIQRGELVAVPVLGEDYILYGVGANASDDPLFHYEVESGRHIPLFARYDIYEDQAREWEAEIERLQAAAEAKARELRGVPRKERKRRAALTAAVREAKSAVEALQKRRTLVASYYEDDDRRRHMAREWSVLQQQAASVPERPLNVLVPANRRVLRARLLSYIRPEARDMMLELAEAYADKFGRPLAFTSLVRTEEYQRALGETNPNATKIAAPPHTTGLAFDLYYRYMTKAEQEFVMDLIAQLEREGRLEALRENRDHIHIFAFATGRRPSESLIAEALGDVRPTRTAVRSGGSDTRRASLSAKKSTARKPTVTKKPTVKKAPVARKKPATTRSRPAARKSRS